MNHPEDYSTDQLKSELLTLDGKGKDFKEKCLEELLSREYQRGWDDGAFNQSFYGQT
jgi:hypothetical protein